MAKSLPIGTRFIVPMNGRKKYIAIMPDGKRVGFGHKDYNHYKDTVPYWLGGQQWGMKNHLDTVRRDRYRARHGALVCKDGSFCIDHKFSPAWFSFYFLW